MLHPVGPLPTAVYWRRRLLVLVGVVGVLGGGGWLGATVATGGTSPDDPVVAGATGAAPEPALEQVVPSLAAVQVPTRGPVDPGTAEPAAAGRVSGGACGDDMISVGVRANPSSTAVGSKPTFDLVVTNTSAVPCVRTLDKGLQEIVLLDGSGNRVWGSNDCYPEASSDQRTLQPGESVVFPVLWSGLSSAPGCAAARTTPGAGSYVLRGRLDAAISGDTAFTLT
ncbi:MucR family transcriptional regulator [Modestobacter versicolor]|uniref:MucR family transcriptional regulator n=1 Tax=Modestobacter versicolor TaxID=429133 RepID=UPI0034DF5179